MEENSSYKDIIKENMKETVSSERRLQRERIVNKRRGILGKVKINKNEFLKTDDVKSIAQRLKHKGLVKDSDFKLLTRAFIQNENNIIAFANSDGALQSLIRELTGTDSNHQLLAAECCVNLALGNEKTSLKIAKSAGTYLITFLKGMSIPLSSAAIWALGNLAGSDVKTLELLKSQGLMESLLDIIGVEDLQSNVIYALMHFVKVGLPVLQPDDLKKIATRTVVLANRTPDTFWLLYYLSCSNVCDELLLPIVQPCIGIIAETDESDTIESIKKKTACVRILANLASAESGNVASLLMAEFDTLFSLFEYMAQEATTPHLCKDMLWMFGNLVNHPAECVRSQVQMNMMRLQHLDLLCIPLRNELK
ncbi:hypothetical protein LSTR_LSTR005547 [Laodelphax striatellus]|uniref:IBB domain-containing protein n=1 Tax=Laodelphax striatellus TaxID=195883 RepID=A0A482WY36_LAOST|nr:hypothetical protein LSTR_LSTR005547 [Laodelphax striatellus]